MEPSQGGNSGGKRRSRQGHDSLRRDDFWNCDLQPETSPCEFNKILSDFGSF